MLISFGNKDIPNWMILFETSCIVRVNVTVNFAALISTPFRDAVYKNWAAVLQKIVLLLFISVLYTFIPSP